MSKLVFPEDKTYARLLLLNAIASIPCLVLAALLGAGFTLASPLLYGLFALLFIFIEANAFTKLAIKMRRAGKASLFLALNDKSLKKQFVYDASTDLCAILSIGITIVFAMTSGANSLPFRYLLRISTVFTCIAMLNHVKQFCEYLFHRRNKDA